MKHTSAGKAPAALVEVVAPKAKLSVAGAVQRKGNVIARVVAAANTATQKRDYPHGIVRHGRAQYVAGAIHTNTIEGFWSIIKRGIVGTFHKVSKKHLQLYVNEFEFRYNNRTNPDILGAAIRAC